VFIQKNTLSRIFYNIHTLKFILRAKLLLTRDLGITKYSSIPSKTLIDAHYLGGIKAAVSKYTTPEKANINNSTLSCKIGRTDETSIVLKIYNYFLF